MMHAPLAVHRQEGILYATIFRVDVSLVNNAEFNSILSSQRPPEADRPLAEKLGSRIVPAKAGIHQWGGHGSRALAGMTMLDVRGVLDVQLLFAFAFFWKGCIMGLL